LQFAALLVVRRAHPGEQGLQCGVVHLSCSSACIALMIGSLNSLGRVVMSKVTAFLGRKSGDASPNLGPLVIAGRSLPVPGIKLPINRSRSNGQAFQTCCHAANSEGRI
jgi:hypothetical protein